ncbi:MAG: hypothetical protein V8Q54_11270 [Alistipes senegalensis]
MERTKKLAAQGIVLRYFFTQRNTFDKMLGEWSESYTIRRSPHRCRGVVRCRGKARRGGDARRAGVEDPTMDVREAERRIAEAEKKLRALDTVRAWPLRRSCSRSAPPLAGRCTASQVTATAQEAADGTLVVMEGWAEKETSGKVDALLEEYPNVVYLKSDPTPEDETPVKLKNGWFARNFELVGDMYARPKYGTMDLTPFFAPFYVLFFGICLNDAGYGAILALMGAFMLS